MQNTDKQPGAQENSDTEAAQPPSSGFGMTGATAQQDQKDQAKDQPVTPEAQTPSPAEEIEATPAESPAGEVAEDTVAEPVADKPVDTAPKEKGSGDSDEMEKQLGDGKKAKKKLTPLIHKSESAKMMEVARERAEKKMGPAGKGAISKQKIQTEFYRDRFHKLVQISLLNAAIIAALIIGMIFYMFKTQPENRFFATTVDGRILKLTPLDEASLTDAELATWVNESIMKTMSFGYHDYQRSLQDSTDFFTKAGWTSFANMLQEMRLIETIEKGQMVVSAEPRSSVEIVQQKVHDGKYRWVVDIDYRITMQGHSGGGTNPLRLRITVDRVPVLENIKGVAIERWSVRPR